MSIRINGTDRASTVGTQSSIPHGTYYLADRTNLFEPQRSNCFEFVVTDLDNLERAGALGVEQNGTFTNAGEMLRLSVSSAFVPHYSQQPVTIQRGNSTVKFAGLPSFDGGSISINDFIGTNTAEILLAWQAKSYNPTTEKVGLASDYKKDAWLIEYTPDWQEVRRWRLHGCWISSLREDEFSVSNGDKRSITVSIEYDRGELDMSEVQ